MKTILLGAALLLLTPMSSLAQTLSLSVQQESSTLPFTRFKELHPGFELSYGLAPVLTAKGNRQWEVSVGYFFHRQLSSSTYLKATHRWTFGLGELAELHLAPSVGYLHSFYPGNVYQQKDGDFVGKTQYGRPHALVEAAFGLGFFPGRTIQPFVRYRFGLESPFANGIPVFPHSFYQIGLSYQLR